MQKYEIMVIIPNTLDAKAAESTYKGLNKRFADEFGAKVTFEDFWGERGFAYQINKQKWGYYGVSQFDMDPAKAKELRHEMNLDNNVVRFLLTKVDPRAANQKSMLICRKSTPL
jgi:small subunit ribosomal protein S6